MGGPNCCRLRTFNEPFVLEGEAAKKFLADMEERERRGNTPEEQAFLDHCVAVYEANEKKRIT